MISYANLTLWIKDSNEYAPFFEKSLYTVVLNDPEKLKPFDLLIQLKAQDEDGDRTCDALTYSIVGPFQKKFEINKFGELRLKSRFDLVTPGAGKKYYNLTVAVTDEGGLSNVANVLLYLNTTLLYMPKGAAASATFSCVNNGARSELDRYDKRIFVPSLFTQANSEYMLSYRLAQSTPRIADLDVNQLTGEVFLRSPLNQTILKNYDK